MGRVPSNFDVLSESVPTFSFSAEKLRIRDKKRYFFDFLTLSPKYCSLSPYFVKIWSAPKLRNLITYHLMKTASKKNVF